MRTISLRPYPGRVSVCKTKKEFYRQHMVVMGHASVSLDTRYGRMVCKWDDLNGGLYVVWAVDKERLAHELSHVILHVFELVDIDPRLAGGEPFCYMLSQLMLDSK